MLKNKNGPWTLVNNNIITHWTLILVSEYYDGMLKMFLFLIYNRFKFNNDQKLYTINNKLLIVYNLLLIVYN